MFDEDVKRRNASELYTHFSAYQTLEEIYDLVAVVDSDISKFEFAKNRIPDIACFSSIENMLIKKVKLVSRRVIFLMFKTIYGLAESIFM